MDERTEQQLRSAFGQGWNCYAKGGYRSDNPHAYDSEEHSAWVIGFDEAKAVMFKEAV